MLDRIFATIGMLGVIAFTGIVTVFVMEPDLWVVTIIVVVVGIAFFVRELKAGERKGENNGRRNT